jgi:hypothetical protein
MGDGVEKILVLDPKIMSILEESAFENVCNDWRLCKTGTRFGILRGNEH